MSMAAHATDYSNTTEFYESNKNGFGPMFFIHMAKYSNKLFQIDMLTGNSETFGEILEKSIHCAEKMKQDGLKPNDVVCFCSENNMDSIVPYIATFLAGGIVAALDPGFPEPDMRYLLQEVQPFMIFASTQCEQKLSKAKTTGKLVVIGESESNTKLNEFSSFVCDTCNFKPVEKDHMDTAVIFFSSGTTGLPKGICLSPFALTNHSNIYPGYADTTVTLGFASLYWISTALVIIRCVLRGHCRMICEKFNTELVWKAIEKYKITTLLPSPMTVMHLIEERYNYDTRSLKDIFFGGVKFSTENLKKLSQVFPGGHLTYLYGQTEVGIFMFFNKTIPEHMQLLKKDPDAVGMINQGYEAKVVDPDTEEILGPNKIGELRILTAFKMNGYYNRDCSDAFDNAGFVKTGDLAYYNEYNCYFIVDRIKEMFKYQGWHITPSNLELILLQHPCVLQAVVVGIPHPRDYNHAIGVVTVDESTSVTTEEILSFYNSKVEDIHKLRGGIKIVRDIPHTPSGKVKRLELKNKIVAGTI